MASRTKTEIPKRVRDDKKNNSIIVMPNQVLNLIQDLTISASNLSLDFI
jgi:hypothetical protein